MSEQNPLEIAVNKIAEKLNEQAPETVVLPREEIIRFVRSQFYVGAAVMLKGVCAVLQLPNDVESLLGGMGVFVDGCSQHIISQENMTLDQIIATMKAHQSG